MGKFVYALVAAASATDVELMVGADATTCTKNTDCAANTNKMTRCATGGTCDDKGTACAATQCVDPTTCTASTMVAKWGTGTTAATGKCLAADAPTTCKKDADCTDKTLTKCLTGKDDKSASQSGCVSAADCTKAASDKTYTLNGVDLKSVTCGAMYLKATVALAAAIYMNM